MKRIKIMNAATILGTVLSFLLAAATAGNTAGIDAPSDRPAPQGHNLNHNETFVQDTASYKTPDAWILWLTPDDAATVAPVLIRLSYTGVTCSPIVCGSNHNETLLREAR
jgi:hypothetical protein